MPNFGTNSFVLVEIKYIHELSGLSLPAWQSLLECEGLMRCRCAIWGLDLVHAHDSLFLCVAKHLFPIRPAKRMLIERAELFYIVVNMLIWFFFLSSGQSHGRSGKNYRTSVLSIDWAMEWCSELEGHKLRIVKIRDMMGCVLLSQGVMNSWACIHMSCYKLIKCVRTVTVL